MLSKFSFWEAVCEAFLLPLAWKHGMLSIRNACGVCWSTVRLCLTNMLHYTPSSQPATVTVVSVVQLFTAEKPLRFLCFLAPLPILLSVSVSPPISACINVSLILKLSLILKQMYYSLVVLKSHIITALLASFPPWCQKWSKFCMFRNQKRYSQCFASAEESLFIQEDAANLGIHLLLL